MNVGICFLLLQIIWKENTSLNITGEYRRAREQQLLCKCAYAATMKRRRMQKRGNGNMWERITAKCKCCQKAEPIAVTVTIARSLTCIAFLLQSIHISHHSPRELYVGFECMRTTNIMKEAKKSSPSLTAHRANVWFNACCLPYYHCLRCSFYPMPLYRSKYTQSVHAVFIWIFPFVRTFAPAVGNEQHTSLTLFGGTAESNCKRVSVCCWTNFLLFNLCRFLCGFWSTVRIPLSLFPCHSFDGWIVELRAISLPPPKAFLCWSKLWKFLALFSFSPPVCACACAWWCFCVCVCESVVLIPMNEREWMNVWMNVSSVCPCMRCWAHMLFRCACLWFHG